MLQSKYYYIDNISKAVKLTLNTEKSEYVYKDKFFNNFQDAKNYQQYILGSYWEELGLEQYIFSLKELAELTEELTKLKEHYQSFIDEYESYGYSIVDLENSEEWKNRKYIKDNYERIMVSYYLPKLLFFDRKIKNTQRRYNYSYQNIPKEQFTKENLEDYWLKYKLQFNNKNEEDKKNLELAKEEQSTIEPVISNIVKIYRDYHNELKLADKRQNDIKNIMILYLSQKEKILNLIRLHKLNILANCPKDSTVEKTSLLKLTTEDVCWNKEYGYNIYQVKKDKILPISYIQEIGDRIVLVTNELNLVHNNSELIIEKKQGNKLEFTNRNLLFFDREEEKLFQKEEIILINKNINPELEDFYGKTLFPEYTIKERGN